MNYDDAATTLAYDTAFWAMAFEDPDYDLKALGSIALEVGRKCRALGILGLMATGSGVHLQENLRRGGGYRLQYLQRVKMQGRIELHHYVRGRVNPVLDLVAAGESRQLQALLEAGPADYRPAHEYLPDHCLVTFLANLSLAAASGEGHEHEALARQALEEYEQWLDGETDPRHDVCLALVEADQAEFLDAFHMLLAQRVEHIEEHRSTDLEDVLIASERLIFVEGLAFLRIARDRGLDVDQDFTLCPRSAMSA